MEDGLMSILRVVRYFVVGALVLAGALAERVSEVAAQDDVTITVSGAADLVYVFEELGRIFEEETGIGVDFNFGSTGQLAQQIEAGAPVDVFAAANIAFVEQLAEQGLTIPATQALYARGRIVIWTLADSELEIDQLDALLSDDVELVAIANPDHAPYGMAAREAMQSAGIWDEIQDKLVLGENIADTLRYGETGNVDVAIVALSLAVQTDGRWILIDEALHEPIDQALTVIAGTPHEDEARAFATFVNSPEGREIMARYGFILPGEELPAEFASSAATPVPAASPEST
jgi:molybdate transport system substrate-binding protein